jgi:uncharacterized membrane protein
MTKAKYDHVDHPLERLMFFSDAVFAIAITLLVIEIKVPHLETTGAGEALLALGNLLPSFLGFVLSFLVIGRFWMAHHSILSVMEHHVPKLMWPNLVLLMSVAFMPFATAMLAEHSQLLVPVVFYNCALLVLALCSAWVSSIASAPENARDGFTAVERATMRGRGHGVVLTTLLSLAATFVAPISPAMGLIALSFMPVIQKQLIKYYIKKLPR